ncbi:MAG: hypothetical protein DRP42_04985 [Tenericutes bacterium]|nr:MAG: hypothetical protein DRP42_04985 [Mycoplasmatota bacterium]
MIEKKSNARNEFYNQIHTSESSYSNFVSLLIYGRGDPEMTEKINEIGITHLFVISGFHVGIFMIILFSLLDYFNMNRNINLLISSSLTFSFL